MLPWWHEIGGRCNIPIDESGVFLSLPGGITLTLYLYEHIINEMKWKSDLRDWPSGLMPNPTAERIVKDVIRRIAINFP